MRIKDLMTIMAGDEEGRSAAEAIVEHLNWLLNTVRNPDSFRPTYGMPELQALLNVGDQELYLAREIRDQIKQFEPRLQAVNVAAEAPDKEVGRSIFKTRFIIKARLELHGERDIFTEEAYVEPDGELKLA